MSLSGITREQRRLILKRDAAMRLRILDSYQSAWDRVESRLEDIQSKSSHGTLKPSDIHEQFRLLQIAQQIESEVKDFSSVAAIGLSEEDSAIVRQAVFDAEKLLLEEVGHLPEGFGFEFKLPSAQIAQLSEKFRDGQDLANTIQRAAPYAAKQVKDALIAGVTIGLNPKQVAREMNRVGQIPMRRAMIIARTEMMRLYRETTLAVYAANKSVTAGWRWLSALDRRTCPVCWSMHGSLHRLSEQMESHPACRCTMVPVLKDWSALKIDKPGRPGTPWLTGALMLGKLAYAAQSEILGPGRQRLLAQGRIGLNHLTEETNHRMLGRGLRLRNIDETLEASRKSDFNVIYHNAPEVIGFRKDGSPVYAIGGGSPRQGFRDLIRMDWSDQDADLFSMFVSASPETFTQTHPDLALLRRIKSSTRSSEWEDWYVRNFPDLDPDQRSSRMLQDISATKQSWIQNNSDSISTLTLQKAAAEEFNLEMAWDPEKGWLAGKSDEIVEEAMQRLDDYWDFTGDRYKILLRAIYEETQEELEREGLEWVPMFRGMRALTTEDEIRKNLEGKILADVHLQPLSSFSALREHAFSYAEPGGFVIEGAVHRSRVIGLGRMGFGDPMEHEAILLGGPGRWRVWDTKFGLPIELSDSDSYDEFLSLHGEPWRWGLEGSRRTNQMFTFIFSPGNSPWISQDVRVIALDSDRFGVGVDRGSPVPAAGLIKIDHIAKSVEIRMLASSSFGASRRVLAEIGRIAAVSRYSITGQSMEQSEIFYRRLGLGMFMDEKLNLEIPPAAVYNLLRDLS
jgi:SPP1 gp7 family putative phage head morphogenesis protein